jgi:hypothetical protein
VTVKPLIERESFPLKIVVRRVPPDRESIQPAPARSNGGLPND